MRLSDFDFELPAEAIAQEARPRGTSRLLVLDALGEARHRTVADLPRLLRQGDLLVVNDTRVVPARLFAERRDTGGRVELLLVERRGPCEWLALTRPAKRLHPGTKLGFPGSALSAEIVESAPGGARWLRFDTPPEPHLEAIGHVPLPPYIRRGDRLDDRERYQTVYARAPGSIAAPTAGLHFTPELLAELEAAGITRAAVTLHVGLGTFKPVAVEDLSQHRMHAERYEIPTATAEAIAATRAAGGRVVAVGTTVVRTLETAAGLAAGGGLAGGGASELFILPGFRFQVVDVLLTNFHLPRSTLLMLVAAFAGRERVLAAYREAVEQGYRFYSYGDAMLLERQLG